MGDSVQKDIPRLLPFYLNRTLDDAERAEVERALAADAALRDELGVLSALRDAVRAEGPDWSPGDLGLARLRREIGGAPRRSWTRTAAALAAAFALGAALTAILARFEVLPDGVTYEQAGAPVSGTVLVVAFRDGATAAEIADLLLSQDATIIDGPSAIGLYHLSLPADADAAAAAQNLLAAGSIVESAELAK